MSTPTSPPSASGAAGVPRTPPAAGHESLGPTPPVVAEPITGSLGSPGRSALAQYRRRRSEELAGWLRGLAWRPPVVAAAGLVAAVLVGWRLRFRPSEQARAWRRGAHGERQTARLLDRLGRDGYVVFHDLAVPGS